LICLFPMLTIPTFLLKPGKLLLTVTPL
jgi:hypothetical protein